MRGSRQKESSRRLPLKGIMSVNTWTPPTYGWITGTLGREAAFSDGHAMFVGKREGKTRPVKPLGAFNHAFRKALLKRLVPTEIERRENIAFWDIPCAVLRGGTWIQQKYYNYAMRFKGVALFLGKAQDSSRKNDRTVICKVGKKVVGVIMPICPQKKVVYANRSERSTT
jgi:hypothetical protein